MPHADDYRTRVIAREARTAASLTRAYHGVWQTVIRPQVDGIVAQMQATLDSGQAVTQSWLHQRNRLLALQDAIHSGVGTFASLAQQSIHAAQGDAATAGVQEARARLQASKPRGVSWSFGVVPPDVVMRQEGALAPHTRVGRLFDTFASDAASAARGTLLTGVALGSSPAVIARQLATDLNAPLQRALTISRTEVLGTWRGAALANYRANDDVVEQWRWQSDHSTNTCAFCLGMDGSLHDLNEDMDSHPNCRCAVVPLTKSWADILGAAGIDADGIDETSNAESDRPSGATYFDNLSEADQVKVLGPAKAAAYRAGDISLADLIGDGQERSLSQLGLDASDYL